VVLNGAVKELEFLRVQDGRNRTEADKGYSDHSSLHTVSYEDDPKQHIGKGPRALELAARDDPQDGEGVISFVLMVRSLTCPLLSFT